MKISLIFFVIIAFVLAFFAPPAGIICSIIAICKVNSVQGGSYSLSYIKKIKTAAIIAMIFGIAFTILIIFWATAFIMWYAGGAGLPR